MWLRTTLILSLLLVGISSYAAPNYKFDLSAGLIYEHTSNILLTPIDTLSDDIVHAVLNTDYERKSPVLDAHFLLNIDNQNFQKNNSFDQTRISSLLNLTSTLTKQRFFWDINNRFDRVQINQTLANAPTNQENTNYLSTGPRLIIITNDKHSLDIGLKYQNFYTERTNTDYQGSAFNAEYTRNITRLFSLGLAGIFTKRKFEDEISNTDYNRTDLILNITKKYKIAQLQMQVGQTKLEPVRGDSSKQNLFSATYDYEHGDKVKLNIYLTRQLSDFSNVFSTGLAGESTFTNVGGEIFLLKEGRVIFVRNFGSSSIQYNYLYISNDYAGNLADLITRSSSVILTNRFANSVSAHVNFTYRRLDYTGVGRRDLTRVYTAGLRKTFLDVYDLFINLQYTNNGSTDSNHIYNERRISVGGHYYFK